MKVTHSTLRYAVGTAVLTTAVGCREPATAPHRVASIAISVPTEITGPVVVRAGVDISSLSGGILYDTISTAVTTTCPFTAPRRGNRVTQNGFELSGSWPVGRAAAP